jgi:hypothetical protein
LIVLCLLDAIGQSDTALKEDDVYTYDYSLKNSRSRAIPALLRKYELPVNLGMSNEGVTVRGAPGLRVFRALQGGGVIMDRSKDEREALILEAIELIRTELMKVVGQKSVVLPASVFEQAGTFVAALLNEVENRSNGRVEQVLVGAKLQLRFPSSGDLPSHPTFAGDRQTNRECDFEIGDIRVIVSVSPKDSHFNSATRLADDKKQVFLVVSNKNATSAKKRIAKEGYVGKVLVSTVEDYVGGNMIEVARDLRLNAHEMCMKLVAEYNRRIAADNDPSLQVAVPD